MREKIVKLACQRHLDDLERAKLAPYKYYFDVEESEKIIDFAEELTIAEGEDEANVTAYPFQCFILGSLNGWRTKEKALQKIQNILCAVRKTERKVIHQWYFSVFLWEF